MLYKFSQESYNVLDLPELPIRIWNYSNHVYHKRATAPKQCPCGIFLRFCIEAARKNWCSCYIDFDFVMKNIQDHDELFGAVFDGILPEDKYKIFILINDFSC